MLVAVFVAGGAALALPRWNRRPAGDPYQALVAARPPRTLAPRTSIPIGWAPCAVEVTDSTLPGGECIPKDGGDKLPALPRLPARSGSAPDADAMRAAALADIVWRGERDARTTRSIDRLQGALLVTRDSVGVMVDLAAAYLVRAGREQSPADLLHALEWSSRALELQPGDTAARFDRALALEALTARREGVRAWDAYLAVEAHSGWAGEARRRRAAMDPSRAPAPPGPRAGEEEIARFTRAYPQQALLQGWDDLLPSWGDALLRGDLAVAGERLERAAALGAGLARDGGDGTLAAAAAAIAAASHDPARLRALAEAHRRYGRARAAYRMIRFTEADSLFRRVARDAPPGTLRGWATGFSAATRIQLRDTAGARRRLDAVAATLDSAREPALAARVAWLRGTLLQRTGRPGLALEEYHAAERIYGRLGERENRGALQFLIADAERSSGGLEAEQAWLQRALATLRPVAASQWRHSVIAALAQAARRRGLDRAARALEDEDVAAAEATGVPAFVVEARMNRARGRAGAGDADGALREVAAAQPLIAGLDPLLRTYFTAVIANTRGTATLQTDPAAAQAAFDTLVSLTGRGQEIWRTRGLAGLARARVALGDTAGGRAALQKLFAALQLQRQKYGGASYREVDGDVRPAVARLVMLFAARGEPVAALRTLEEATAALSSARVRAAVAPRPVPAGRTVVRTLVVGDTLLLWTLSGRSVRLDRVALPPGGLDGAVVRTHAALRRGFAEVARAQLTDLHELLVRPIANRLPQAGGEVVFVHDGDLAGVPFAALLDPRTGRYLVEDHAVWVATSVAAAVTPAAEGVTATIEAAFVDPTFDKDKNRGLEPLPGARREVADAARGYRTRFLRDTAATPGAVANLLSSSVILHFAGHAVSDERRPERSYLVLAPQPGAPDGHLAASTLEALDLRRLRLVVLSACTSLVEGDPGSGGIAGLSGALLGAGAQGVVGSLWQVDDESTRELMVRFHAGYRQRGDAARALQAAQLALLRASNPRLRSPAAWGAFVYVAR